MAYAVWPVAVPFKPELGDYAIPELFAKWTEKEVEGGPAIRRIRSNQITEKQTITLTLTGEEWATLLTFIRDTLVQGTQYFTLAGARVGGSATTSTKLCYLATQPTAKMQGPDTWSVAFTLAIFIWS